MGVARATCEHRLWATRAHSLERPVIDPDLKAEIQRLEEALLDPAARRDGEQLSILLADGFLEFGSSGRAFTKSEAVGAMAGAHDTKYSLQEFDALALSPDVVLATYVARARGGEPDRYSLRSSVWVRRGAHWQLLFHQGTSTGSTPDPAGLILAGRRPGQA
jgi:hypothetical protein